VASIVYILVSSRLVRFGSAVIVARALFRLKGLSPLRSARSPAAVVANLSVVLGLLRHGLCQRSNFLLTSGRLSLLLQGSCPLLGFLGALVVGTLSLLNFLACVFLLLGHLLSLNLLACLADVHCPGSCVEVGLGAQTGKAVERRSRKGRHGGYWAGGGSNRAEGWRSRGGRARGLLCKVGLEIGPAGYIDEARGLGRRGRCGSQARTDAQRTLRFGRVGIGRRSLTVQRGATGADAGVGEARL
jgi:hypothetical protein